MWLLHEKVILHVNYSSCVQIIVKIYHFFELIVDNICLPHLFDTSFDIPQKVIKTAYNKYNDAILSFKR